MTGERNESRSAEDSAAEASAEESEGGIAEENVQDVKDEKHMEIEEEGTDLVSEEEAGEKNRLADAMESSDDDNKPTGRFSKGRIE